MDQPNISLTQIFVLTDDSEIPIDIEDATLQVIKKDTSNNNLIEFKTDCPWVRFFSLLQNRAPNQLLAMFPLLFPKNIKKPEPLEFFLGYKKEIIVLKLVNFFITNKATSLCRFKIPHFPQENKTKSSKCVCFMFGLVRDRAFPFYKIYSC